MLTYGASVHARSHSSVYHPACQQLLPFQSVGHNYVVMWLHAVQGISASGPGPGWRGRNGEAALAPGKSL